MLLFPRARILGSKNKDIEQEVELLNIPNTPFARIYFSVT